MTRRRYMQDPETFELIEIFEDEKLLKSDRRLDASLWNDRNYLDSQTTDGVDISSRTKHRQYMKQHGLCTFDDYKGEFERREKSREAYFTGQKGSINKRDIYQAIEQLKRG